MGINLCAESGPSCVGAPGCLKDEVPLAWLGNPVTLQLVKETTRWVTFVGGHSEGKSTLINRLLGYHSVLNGPTDEWAEQAPGTDRTATREPSLSFIFFDVPGFSDA